MATNFVKTNIILRHDTGQNWEIKNPVLLKGEAAVNTDNNLVKIGDGENPWKALPYINDISSAITAKNIQTALGYNPVKDVQVAGSSVLVDGVGNIKIGSGLDVDKNGIYVPNITIGMITGRMNNKALTANAIDNIVKAAMCDGKGTAWTSDEQKAARERMGIDKPYEIIKSVTTTEDVNQVVISLDNDGNDFTLNGAIIFIEYGGSNNGSIYSLCEGTKTDGRLSICAYDFMGYTAQNKHSVFCCFVENGYWNALSYLPRSKYLSREIRGLSADSFMKNSVFVVPHINRIRVYANTGAGTSQVPAGTKIDVWGVRVNA